MSTRYFCTYFDQNYLAKGLAMIESLRQHGPSVEIHVCCMDEASRSRLERLSLSNVVLVPLSEIEQGDDALVEPKQSRTLVEYYWTLTPTIILRILERNPHIDRLSYVDADLFFYSDPEPIFEEMGDRDVLIHEHRFPPRLAGLVENGIYNVGWLTFRRSEQGLETLNWWRDRCIEWCFKRIEDGKMGDQLYLNDWPERFESVAVLQHLGAGLGPWNHEQYVYDEGSDGAGLVSGQRIIFYHFHSFAIVTPDVMIPCTGLLYVLTEPIVRWLCVPYAEALRASIAAIRRVDPDFTAGIKASGQLGAQFAFIATKQVAEAVRAAPQPKRDLGSNWDLYAGPQLVESSQVQVHPPPKTDSLSAPTTKQVQPQVASSPQAPPATNDDADESLRALQQAGLLAAGAPVQLRLTTAGDTMAGFISITADPKHPGQSECSSELGTLTFPENSVDILVVDGVLDQLPLALCAAYLGRWCRWLKPDGTIELRVTDTQNLLAALDQSRAPADLVAANKAFGTDSQKERRSWWTLGSVKAILTLTGFEPQRHGQAPQGRLSVSARRASTGPLPAQQLMGLIESLNS